MGAVLTDAQRDALAMLATHHALAPWTWITVRRAAAKTSCRQLARLGFAEVREEGGFFTRITASGLTFAAGIALAKAGA